ncbi:MAG: hypothetical protein FWE23_01810 [Chitinivibrionia bacterium]|nr:hypothetical protein [Chitinivibrionia bacterium]
MTSFLFSLVGLIGEYVLNMSLIIFGGVVVRGLFGDGTEKNEIRWAIIAMAVLFFVGASFMIAVFLRGGAL